MIEIKTETKTGRDETTTNCKAGIHEKKFRKK